MNFQTQVVTSTRNSAIGTNTDHARFIRRKSIHKAIRTMWNLGILHKWDLSLPFAELEPGPAWMRWLP